MESILLRNGQRLPSIGLGTWQITDRELMKTVVKDAYDAGYRLIDTAAAYSNEIAIAKSIAELGIAREHFILADKVWNTSRGYEAVREACKKSLKKLRTDYLDLYLIHWPAPMKRVRDWAEINADTWRGMESLYEAGIVKAIGVCNFKEHHLRELKKTARIMPFINQIECHPGMNQVELIQYCFQSGIQVTASSPLGNGQILSNEIIKKIAEFHGKSPAQVCLRWALQKGLSAIPKTSNKNRLRENIALFDFVISDTEMEQINRVPYCGGIGIDPDEVNQIE